MTNLILRETIIKLRHITDEDYERIAYAAEGKSSVYDALLDGVVSEHELHAALAERLGLAMLPPCMPSVDLELFQQFSRETLLRYCALPLGINDGILDVAMYNPFDMYVLNDIRENYGFNPRAVLLPRKNILEGIEYYCSDIEARTAALADSFGSEVYAVDFVNALIKYGFAAGASDIHIEPFDGKTSIRLRIDGAVRDYCVIPDNGHSTVISRIKVMANLNIAEHNSPQDGSMVFVTEDSEGIHIRVSIMPTIYGEKAVLRFLDFEGDIDNAAFCGMEESSYRKLEQMLEAPSGLIYFTGPTGSGKSTTLYMILERLAQRPVNICTIEDPVERRIPKVNQTEVNPKAGVYFPEGLRAALRQDPDIIMVGETRDPETAAVSARAAMTGHLVLSTLHTSDSVSTIARLEDLGIEPFMTVDTLLGAVAQRLVRKICPNCVEEYMATESDRAFAGEDISFLRRGRGCYYCNHTGYKGRIAVHEVLVTDSNVRKMIFNRETTEAIREYAVKQQGMRLLPDTIKHLVRSGVTTVEEGRKVSHFPW